MALYEIDGQRPTLAEDGSSWVAPGAQLIGDARLGRDVGIWFRVVVRADNTPIAIGDCSNVQEGAILHSDPGIPCTIGIGVTIGHRAILHGCTIGDNVLIGMGATVLNRAHIAENCLVGAGALVTEGKSFPPGSLIVGSPARVIRPLTEAEIEGLRQSALSYARRARDYAAGLTRID